jgi:Acetyltransferase (GNAT) family
MAIIRSHKVVIESVKYSDIKEIYRQIVVEKLEKIVFYDIENFSSSRFFRFVRSHEGWFYVVRNKEGVLLGFICMSHIENRTCRLHFCTFRVGRPYLITGGKQVLDWLVPEGFDSVIGWLPEWNTSAIKYLKRLGFYIVGRIPGAIGSCHRADCAAIMSVYTKEVNDEKKNL